MPVRKKVEPRVKKRRFLILDRDNVDILDHEVNEEDLPRIVKNGLESGIDHDSIEIYEKVATVTHGLPEIKFL